MSAKRVSITFTGEKWEESVEAVCWIIKESGTYNFQQHMTKTIPPIICGIVLKEEDIERLKKINGVTVDVHEDD